MAIEINHTSLVIVMSSVFQDGMKDGITRHFHGDTPGRPMTEEDVIDFLQGNFIEPALEGYLDEERLRENAGGKLTEGLTDFVLKDGNQPARRLRNRLWSR